MKGEQKDIEEAVEELGIKISPEVTSEIKNLKNQLAKGATGKDLLGLNDQVIEGIYGQAFRLYNTGKYKEASQLFRLLVMLDGTGPKYAMGLAACFHMLKEYSAAAELYTVCGLLDPQSPIPHYHASDCYIELGDKPSAIIALEMAIKRAKDRQEFSQLKDRALMTIDSLKEEKQE